MKQAFVLGAGKGTRLKSLTAALPKPLIPLHQKPLITYAFDHLISVGFDQFMVNTHHLPEHYAPAFPDARYRNCPLSFRFEQQLLETGGGIANIADWLPQNESFMVYNGDILSDMNLAPVIEAHQNSDNIVTLVLRSQGEALQIGWHPESGKITDIRNSLQTAAHQLYQFTGIYLVRPDFLNFLTPGKKESVIPAFMALIEKNALGGVVIDDGTWSDLGTRGTYLRASAALSTNGFPQYGRQDDQQRIHPSAQIHPSAHVCPLSSIAQDCVVAADARIDNSILWADSQVAKQASLRNVIVRSGQTATGILLDADV
ncbi:MAG: NTP transferase domain-containing protein [Verrucomicrobiales bacterium]|nr:NTP transferase domain-containing protein [Verrucomicrobiales bacterium]